MTGPTGHFFGIDDIIPRVIIGAVPGAVVAKVTDNNMATGFVLGAQSGGFIGWAVNGLEAIGGAARWLCLP